MGKAACWKKCSYAQYCFYAAGEGNGEKYCDKYRAERRSNIADTKGDLALMIGTEAYNEYVADLQKTTGTPEKPNYAQPVERPIDVVKPTKGEDPFVALLKARAEATKAHENPAQRRARKRIYNEADLDARYADLMGEARRTRSKIDDRAVDASFDTSALGRKHTAVVEAAISETGDMANIDRSLDGAFKSARKDDMDHQYD